MNRNLSVDRSSSDEVLVTAPTAFQVEPLSVEYCQVPLLLTSEVTAIPLTAPVSTSAILVAIKVETKSPLLEVLSSVMVVKLLAPESVGASLTAVAEMLATAVAVLKAVVVPLVEVSTFVPNEPEV